MKRARVITLAAIGIALLLIGVNGVKVRRELTTYCEETGRGETLVRAAERARQSGFRFFPGVAGADNRAALVTASGVLGRLVCEVEHDGTMVLGTGLRFND